MHGGGGEDAVFLTVKQSGERSATSPLQEASPAEGISTMMRKKSQGTRQSSALDLWERGASWNFVSMNLEGTCDLQRRGQAIPAASHRPRTGCVARCEASVPRSS